MIGHATAPAPPVIVSPGPRQASFGAISGRVGQRAETIVVRIDGHLRASVKARGTHFSFHVRLPAREVSIRVTALDRFGRGASTTVSPVLGLPASAAPRYVRGYRDGRLSFLIGKLVRRYSGTAGIFVEDLRTGAGAAWNARAHFPAASTLKLAIAVQVLRTLGGRPPSPSSSVGSLMHSMLAYSDNVAANQLLDFVGGPAAVTETMRAIGLSDSDMCCGYVPDTRARWKTRRPIPVNTVSQPDIPGGKYTSAWDLARLLRHVELAAAGKGLLARRFPTFTSADARYLLYELAHVRDPGKLSRFLGRSVRVAHKAGWNSTVRHDNGLVFWRHGSFVVTVMTWRPWGVGVSSDILAGRVASLALRRFARLARG